MITALSPALSVRSQIIQKLKADPAFSDLVARVYPGKLPNNPVRPFCFLPTPTGTPVWRDGSAGGSDLRGRVHVFAGPTSNAPDAEAFCARVNAQIVRILADLDLVVEEVAVGTHPTLDQVIRDPDEADGWHGMVDYEASAS